MKHNLALTVTSLLSIVLFTLHLTDDIVRGIEPGTLSNLVGVLILVVWLYGTLVLAGRRSGHVILLLGSLLGSGVPILHFRGAGVARIAKSSGGFLFIWTLLALGVTALFSLILCVRGLWSLRRTASASNEGANRNVAV
ncbi:MAG TPA: hypothetical protein VJ276_07375 [Thermoanaerobaculia bacterium]|nr:hypothetical protein [Thermoanaerobaculia bacterium]